MESIINIDLAVTEIVFTPLLCIFFVIFLSFFMVYGTFSGLTAKIYNEYCETVGNLLA